MKSICLFLLFMISRAGFAQAPDSVYVDYIRTPQLYSYGNQVAYPVIGLNSGDRLELHFDDLDADAKNYFYTYQLCNADWTPVAISQFDYIKGFMQLRINAYRYSSIALTRYTHYQAIVPDVSCIPTRSGNYLLKIFLDGDTSKLVFTRRFLVLQDGASIAAQILQPFNPRTAYTHQKIQFNINTRALNIIDANQQLKVVILQNERWDIAVSGIRPSFYSGSNFQYNSDDDCVIPAGKQWRWLDIQSFRYQSDRVQHADYLKNSTTIYVKPDVDRSRQSYYYYNDVNGQYYIQTTESINPLWQTDYARVRFSFVPPGSIPFPDKDVYLLGKFTDYQLSDSTKMEFNVGRGMYEASALLKMGYYNYAYVTVNHDDSLRKPSFDFTEGNNMETENEYTILVYYRELGGRADQLVGRATLNSLAARP
ncbi:MAG TPA: DUF5103 domain-containing protein [Puia sp.]|nr:DUF5103 domain-containing protein [Puia sp.]